MASKNIILGGGITGLSAGFCSGYPVYEATGSPGGICASYYMDSKGNKSAHRHKAATYRFEKGGGHWIFGASGNVLDHITSLVELHRFRRRASVFFPRNQAFVPYPLQDHIAYFPERIRKKILREISLRRPPHARTLKEWLRARFGDTLCELFFFPFHEKYTAGMYSVIAPGDTFKTPLSKPRKLAHTRQRDYQRGYNAEFMYPAHGLDELIVRMAAGCKLYLNKRAVKVNLRKKEILFADGSGARYQHLISTIPLPELLHMSGATKSMELPFTSVLVVNIGARKDKGCPDDHWLYTPQSTAGFYRIGFYSNVDESFLPHSSRHHDERVGIYVERAYRGGEKPTPRHIRDFCQACVHELKIRGMIREAEVVDATWIKCAYTWEYPGSTYRTEALRSLARQDIVSIGRYGKWKFQGIAASIKDGLSLRRPDAYRKIIPLNS